MQKLYGLSHMALAGLVPASLVTKEGFLNRTSDLALGVALPVHSHIAMNYVVSDYVPKTLQLPVRVGILGMSAVAFLGLLKLNTTGAGITGTLRQLWKKRE